MSSTKDKTERWSLRKTAAWLDCDDSVLRRACEREAPDISTKDGVDFMRAAPVACKWFKSQVKKRANSPGKIRREEAEADRSEMKAAEMAGTLIERDTVMAALRDWQAELIREISAMPLENETRDKLFQVMRDASEIAANGIELEKQEPDSVQG